MRSDPLQGKSPRERRKLEAEAAKYIEAYQPDEHTGWFADAFRSADPQVFIAPRLDLDHPALPGRTLYLDCSDCGANLQLDPAELPDGVPVLCLCCAAERAVSDT